jgi:hypothetical protein
LSEHCSFNDYLHSNGVFDGGGWMLTALESITDNVTVTVCEVVTSSYDPCYLPPTVLCDALYISSDFKNLYFCTQLNCSSCSSNHSNFISSLHSAVGFLSFAPSSASPPSTSSPPFVVSSHSFYLDIQSFYTGVPNFISKVAHVAAHIYFSLLCGLSQ